MATIQGTGGTFSAAGFNAKIISWTASINGEVFSTTGFGDKAWQTGKVITGQMVGNAIGVLEGGGAAAPIVAGFNAADTFVGSAMKVACTLTVSAGHTYTFYAVISAVEIGRAETGAGSSTYNISFQSTGRVTQSAWA